MKGPYAQSVYSASSDHTEGPGAWRVIGRGLTVVSETSDDYCRLVALRLHCIAAVQLPPAGLRSELVDEAPSTDAGHYTTCVVVSVTAAIHQHLQTLEASAYRTAAQRGRCRPTVKLFLPYVGYCAKFRRSGGVQGVLQKKINRAPGDPVQLVGGVWLTMRNIPLLTYFTKFGRSRSNGENFTAEVPSPGQCSNSNRVQVGRSEIV